MSTLNNITGKKIDIKYYLNDDFDLSFSVTDQDDNDVDLSTKSLSMQIKKRKTDTTSLIELTTAAGDIVVSGDNNNILTFNGTLALSERVYVYDLENTTDSNTIMYGFFKVTGDVTRI